jgi:hypothetical protein
MSNVKQMQTPSANLTVDLAERMVELADALVPLANDASQIHYDLREGGVWGTGVTEGLAGRLASTSDQLRDLVRLASEARSVVGDYA